MTNIQAIDLLKNLEQSLDDYCELNDEGKTAFRIAITALEVFGNSEQLPSAHQYTNDEIQKIQDLEQAQFNKMYELGKQTAQPEPHEIGYSECANSTLKMWIDNVLTDGEYSHIMDKLNAYWAERRENEEENRRTNTGVR